MHFDQLQMHGGLPGVKSDNAVDAALARPRHQWAYGSAGDVFDLAAAYGFALATTHGYCDGNKRIAFVVTSPFLGVNGWDLDAAEPEVVHIVLDLVTGVCDEAQFATWLRTHSRPWTD